MKEGLFRGLLRDNDWHQDFLSKFFTFFFNLPGCYTRSLTFPVTGHGDEVHPWGERHAGEFL